MQYLLMLYAEEAGWNKLTKAEMARMWSRKSRSVATILSTWPIWMRRSPGHRVARAQVTASSRCVHPGACRRELRCRVNG